jgi:hypothetical protein
MACLGSLGCAALIPDVSWGHGSIIVDATDGASPMVGVAVLTIVACMVAAPICMFALLVWSDRRRRRLLQREREREQAAEESDPGVVAKPRSHEYHRHHRVVH